MRAGIGQINRQTGAVVREQCADCVKEAAAAAVSLKGAGSRAGDAPPLKPQSSADVLLRRRSSVFSSPIKRRALEDAPPASARAALLSISPPKDDDEADVEGGDGAGGAAADSSYDGVARGGILSEDMG